MLEGTLIVGLLWKKALGKIVTAPFSSRCILGSMGTLPVMVRN